MANPRIRVLVTAFAPVPGSNAYAAALIGMAAAVRAEIDMITLKTETLPLQQRLGDARLYRVPVSGETPKERRASFGRAIRRQLEAQPYDIVHAHGPFEGQVIAVHRPDMDFRFVYEVGTFADEAEGPDSVQIWEQAHLRCLHTADLILVSTEAACRALADRGFGDKLAVVPPGVDVNALDWWPAARHDLGRVLYLGSFAADRELATLLGAVRKVSKQRGVRVLIAGEPDSGRRRRLRRLVANLGLSDSVVVRGEPRAGSLPMLIAACDVGVVTASASPRFQEFGDLPVPLLEYMACRRAVVAAGIPGVAEVIRDEREGLLYPPGDEDVLADGVLSLLKGGPLRERLIERAYLRARSRFSGAARRRRIAEVYERLAPGSQRFDAWEDEFDKAGSPFVDLSSSMFEVPTQEREAPPTHRVERPHSDLDASTSAETPLETDLAALNEVQTRIDAITDIEGLRETRDEPDTGVNRTSDD